MFTKQLHIGIFIRLANNPAFGDRDVEDQGGACKEPFGSSKHNTLGLDTVLRLDASPTVISNRKFHPDPACKPSVLLPTVRHPCPSLLFLIRWRRSPGPIGRCALSRFPPHQFLHTFTQTSNATQMSQCIAANLKVHSLSSPTDQD